MKPAHIGELCAACFRAAAPARRAVELQAARLGCEDVKEGAEAARKARAARERLAWDRDMQTLLDGPAYGEAA